MIKRFFLMISFFMVALMAYGAEQAPMITNDGVPEETAEPLYYFSSESREKNFNQLIHSLKCPVCEHETLAETNTPMAARLKSYLAMRLEKGDLASDLEVQYVKQFGEKTRLRPRFETKTSLLWTGPLILIIIVGILLRGLFSGKRYK